MSNQLPIAPIVPDDFFTKSETKQTVTIRLDRDVIEFFRSVTSRGYQTKMNAVLRAFMEQNKHKTP